MLIRMELIMMSQAARGGEIMTSQSGCFSSSRRLSSFANGVSFTALSIRPSPSDFFTSTDLAADSISEIMLLYSSGVISTFTGWIASTPLSTTTTSTGFFGWNFVLFALCPSMWHNPHFILMSCTGLIQMPDKSVFRKMDSAGSRN